MCTALSLKTKDHYFGRNLDLDRSYGEEVCVMPRRFPLEFRKMGDICEHYAMVGMATVVDELPLFYEATNEMGLSMAGLNFPDNAYYPPVFDGKDNIAPFEFIPWILGQCKTVSEAKSLLSRINLADIAFSEELPQTPLHWMILDREESIVVEPMRDGLHIHENPYGVLTNNPPFEYHVANLEKHRHLHGDKLPGDTSSESRFVRMSFFRESSVCDDDELSSVGQFFHLLSSVEVIKGARKTEEGAWHFTRYSSCANTDKGLYYYTTYGNRRITCVNMHSVELNSDKVCRFPLLEKQSIKYIN